METQWPNSQTPGEAYFLQRNYSIYAILGTLMSFWHGAGGNAACAYQIESFLYSDPIRQLGLGM